MRKFILFGVLLLLVALGTGLAVRHGALSMEGITQLVERLGPWGPVAMIGLMIAHCFVPLPAEVLALCAGALFGTVYGTALIWCGAMIGALLSFGLARLLGRGAVEALLPARHHAALEHHDGQITALLVSRFIPLIAFNLINYAAGLTRIGWWPFTWTTGLGILPLTTLMVAMGAHMKHLTWGQLALVSGAGIVLILGLHWLARRRGWLGP